MTSEKWASGASSFNPPAVTTLENEVPTTRPDIGAPSRQMRSARRFIPRDVRGQRPRPHARSASAGHSISAAAAARPRTHPVESVGTSPRERCSPSDGSSPGTTPGSFRTDLDPGPASMCQDCSARSGRRSVATQGADFILCMVSDTVRGYRRVGEISSDPSRPSTPSAAACDQRRQ